ncbi:hypothetical protein [Sorangium sp. So ce117]|jgi:hypothetical protein|uniref:hypothetical protein n=1 Tax=Sorangium sp. So ce117 TaxID=3133277 RepID=UPI003F5E816B
MGQYDIALRHIALRCGDELAQGLRLSFPVEAFSWVETQLTALERRIARVLELRGGGQRRLVQLEFIVAPESDLALRMCEYAVLLVLSLRAAGDPCRGDGAIPPVESVAVLLSGRAAPWPLEIATHTGKWEKTGLRGLWQDLLKLMMTDFPWTLAPIE